MTTANWISAHQAAAQLPLVAVHEAIRARNEEALWKGYVQSQNPEAYLDWIANAVGGRIVRHQRVQEDEHHVLIAVPLVLPPCDFERVDAGSWIAHDLRLRQALARWVPACHSLALSPSLAPFSEVSRWSPLRQLELLDELSGVTANHPPALLLQEAAASIGGLPQLWFATASLKSCRAEPDLPSSGSEAELGLRCMMAAQVGYELGVPVDLDSVSIPARFNEAVQSGLELWLSRILAMNIARTWSIDPVGGDAVRMCLWGHQRELVVSYPVRLHQLVPHGLDLISLLLADALEPHEEPELAAPRQRGPARWPG